MFRKIGFEYGKDLWKIENLELNRINLFVGISGVGKTRTLQSIMNLKKIVLGNYVNGFSWNVEFDIHDKKYKWKGKFNKVDEEDIEVIGSKVGINIKLKKPRLVYEYLGERNREILYLSENETRYRNQNLPQLNQRSLVNVLQGETEIAEIANFFTNLFEFNYDQEYRIAIKEKVVSAVAAKINTLEKLKQTDIPIVNKLCILSRIDKRSFNCIVEQFKEIFPFVTNVKFDIYSDENMIMYIQESGTWIPQHEMSSGMFKTILMISELMLLAPNSVAIIDEFENGLGVNCINKVAEIINQSNDTQFIMSSHHPYIINNFAPSTWKIFGRESGYVVVKKADDINIGKSSHEYFKQLINNDNFINGIKR